MIRTLGRAAVRDAGLAWRVAAGGSRWLYAAGLLLMASGLLHTLVWAVDGSSWSGPLAWRKPILFGLATGVTCLSLGWVLGLFGWRRGARWVGASLATVAVVEVALISLQAWRGVPSHFNMATPLDSAITLAIDGLVLALTVLVAVMTVRSLGRLQTAGRALDDDLVWAVRVGMTLLLVGCLLGVWMLDYGGRRIATGAAPEIFGRAGVVKFAHGMPLHAIQVLPLLGYLLRTTGIVRARRPALMQCAALGLVLLSLFAAVQTFSGRSRADLTVGSGGLLVVALGLSAWPWLVALSRAVLTRSRASRPPPVPAPRRA